MGEEGREIEAEVSQEVAVGDKGSDFSGYLSLFSSGYNTSKTLFDINPLRTLEGGISQLHLRSDEVLLNRNTPSLFKLLKALNQGHFTTIQSVLHPMNWTHAMSILSVSACVRINICTTEGRFDPGKTHVFLLRPPSSYANSVYPSKQLVSSVVGEGGRALCYWVETLALSPRAGQRH